MTFNPLDHKTNCPEHNVTACATCHEVEGECTSGGCFKKATRSFAVTRNANDSIAYVAHLCDSETCRTLLAQACHPIARLVS